MTTDRAYEYRAKNRARGEKYHTIRFQRRVVRKLALKREPGKRGKKGRTEKEVLRLMRYYPDISNAEIRYLLGINDQRVGQICRKNNVKLIGTYRFTKKPDIKFAWCKDCEKPFYSNSKRKRKGRLCDNCRYNRYNFTSYCIGCGQFYEMKRQSFVNGVLSENKNILYHSIECKQMHRKEKRMSKT